MFQRILALVVLVAMAVLGFVQETAQTAGKLSLPGVISNHMVLQCGITAPIWGTAAPGAHVTVSFADQNKTTQADAKGAWRVNLEPLSASDKPQAMSITAVSVDSKKSSVVIKDVLIGEVWVGSGQSNMKTPVSFYTNDSVLIANAFAEYPLVRLLPAAEANWKLATPATVCNFTALLFSFGVPLQKTLHVPIGLIAGAMGGTPSRLWISEATYRGDAKCQEAAAKARITRTDEPGNTSQPPGESNTCPDTGRLYERWICPLQPYAIRGVLWDQGESGTGIRGVDQDTLMGALIRGWRQDWGQGDFPFFYVQKPSGGGCAWDPSDPVTRKADAFAPLPPTPPNDGLDREISIRIMRNTNTTMVTASDLGQGLHPDCKSGYGMRAARVALSVVYGQPGEYYGPIYLSHAVEGNKIRVRFTHVGQGLASRPADKLQGFAIACADKRFYWADAVIEGDTVVVSSDKVPSPVAVRYAFSNIHPWANLFNKDGLPALLFRTDTW